MHYQIRSEFCCDVGRGNDSTPPSSCALPREKRLVGTMRLIYQLVVGSAVATSHPIYDHGSVPLALVWSGLPGGNAVAIGGFRSVDCTATNGTFASHFSKTQTHGNLLQRSATSPTQELCPAFSEWPSALAVTGPKPTPPP